MEFNWIDVLLAIVYIVGAWRLIILTTEFLTHIYEVIYFKIYQKVTGLPGAYGYGRIMNWSSNKNRYK